MFRKHLILAALVLTSLVSGAQNNPFYYEHIFNPSKTIDFVFAFYPTSYQHFELHDNDTCTTFKCFTINKTTGSLKWNEYKVRIELKDGRQVTSLLAAAKEGRLACSYTIPGKENHTQFYCFHDKFTGDDVSRIWLIMEDDNKFELRLYKEDK